MGFVLRRSLPSVAGLLALVLAIGGLLVVFAGAPVWFPAFFAIAVILLQYAINPRIVEWLVPASVIPNDGTRYLTDHPLGEVVARRCRDAGVPLVRLGIVDDGMPNAFTFGHRPSDARMWVTRGLLERLDQDELDAVVTHEVGHVKNWDFVVMTVAAVVPMLLYFLFLMTRFSRDRRVQAVTLGAYIAYIVSQFILLALSRAREYGADHWSCECTGNGDALASALVKVAYGMGQVRAQEQTEAVALVAAGKQGQAEAARREAQTNRIRSMRTMGIFEPRAADAMAVAFEHGIDSQRAVAAMRWDTVNPWGRTLEKLASHPLVAHRIQALEESGLPGAPRVWSVLRATADVDPSVRLSLRARWARELVIAVGPWALLAAVVLFGAFTRSTTAIGLAMVLFGGGLLVKQLLRYPLHGHEPVEEVTSLLERLEAGPVAGMPVEVHGRIIGRGSPGYLLSPDMVIQDESGFVPLLYRQPIPFARAWFGLSKLRDYLGQHVTATGWFRRSPGPVIELREVQADGGQTARTWWYPIAYGLSAVVLLVGIIVTLVGIAGG
ncbi:MAG TPA: zinc metalloprotease HtpX [Acidimicrobiales bacterium]|nr:zinc metalloprotease HtpX [Acidimicrobiales bacterium]